VLCYDILHMSKPNNVFAHRNVLLRGKVVYLNLPIVVSKMLKLFVCICTVTTMLHILIPFHVIFHTKHFSTL